MNVARTAAISHNAIPPGVHWLFARMMMPVRTVLQPD